MAKHSLKDRFRYAFDNTMSKGTVALIGWLGLLSLVLIFVISVVVWLLKLSPDTPLSKVIWMSLMRTLDAGTMGGDEGSWSFLFAMFAVTLGGVFVISTLIGVLTTGIENKLDELRKGRSYVIEEGHTVILGWSDHVFSIISELVVANQERKSGCVVVLADKDKVEMQEEIQDKVGDTKNTRVVCRTGRPVDLNDLEIAGIHASRSIVVLAPAVEEPDPEVVKIILAITNHPNRRSSPYHVVAEIHDPKNMEIAKMVGKDEVELVLVSDLIARIIAQTCLQSGLSVVYQELLDFDGDEMYFFGDPSLNGKKFGDTLMLFPKAAVMGLFPKGGVPRLNPPMDTVLQDGDQLVVVAADEHATRLSNPSNFDINTSAIRDAAPNPPHPEQVLILGWNWRAPTIINQLDCYLAPGSTIAVVARYEDAQAKIDKFCSEPKNCKITFREGDTTERRLLDSLNVPSFKHIILLSDSDQLQPHQADARTLFTLLHLRDIAEHVGKSFSIVSEMLDVKNRELAEVARADDFIVSDKIVSLMMSQVSENKMLNAVFADVFDPEGSEIYLKPAENYVQPGTAVNFYTVIEAARRRAEIAIGFRHVADASDASKAYGVTVNPQKEEQVTFAPGDKVVVVAES